MYSASAIETILGDPARSTTLLSRSCNIQKAVESLLWSEDGGYYYRSISSTTLLPDTCIDSSSVAIIFTGLTTNTTRSTSHMNRVNAALTKLGSGLARYEGDVFFYTSKFNPGGQETSGPEPAWGVVTMFAAWAEHYLNKDISQRLAWMSKYAAPGSMPVGEAIDSYTGEFVMTSCPDIYEHGAVFVWSILIDQKLSTGPDPHLFHK